MDKVKTQEDIVLTNEQLHVPVADIIAGFSSSVNDTLLHADRFSDFIKILEAYKLKHVARNCSNFYFDSKENISYRRKETTAEHIYSCLKLADYFIFSEEEFKNLDRLKVYEIIMYHDDIEIETEDTCISQTELRKDKASLEISSLPILTSRYPSKLSGRLYGLDSEYRSNATPESMFVHAIDKMDALVHELQYPADWGPKGFSKDNVIKWFGGAFSYSPTFSRYFSSILDFLENNHYFS